MLFQAVGVRYVQSDRRKENLEVDLREGKIFVNGEVVQRKEFNGIQLRFLVEKKLYMVFDEDNPSLSIAKMNALLPNNGVKAVANDKKKKHKQRQQNKVGWGW